MKKAVKTTVLIVVIISVVSILFGCGDGENGESGGLPAPGKHAPPFELKTLDGETVTLASLEGRPVVINFWATWCGPCRIEIPILQQLHESPEWRARGLVVIGVNLGEPPESVQGFVQAFDMSFLVLLDSTQQVSMAYNAAFIPTTYFIDGDGIIRNIKVGAILSLGSIEPQLNDLLGKYED